LKIFTHQVHRLIKEKDELFDQLTFA